MTEHNQKLEPSAFEPSGNPTSTTEASAGISAAVPQRAGANSQRVLISALVGLGLVALAVFFWLPALVTPPAVETAAATPLAGTATRPAARTESSPWSDAQLAKQRKQAQDVLE